MWARSAGTAPIAAAATGYSTADSFKFVTGDTVISSSGEPILPLAPFLTLPTFSDQYRSGKLHHNIDLPMQPQISNGGESWALI